MSLPASLLTAAESHPCFSGCYTRETASTLVVDPSTPTVTSYEVSCQDCRSFRVGVLESLLPTNYTSFQLAADLSAHVRGIRGYAWAVSGYHGNLNGGAWLSAVSFGNGVLLADASRNRGGASDLDVLVDAFKARIVTPEDPGMVDPKLYTAESVYVDLSAPFGVVRSKQDILASAQCSRTPQAGFHRVTVLEFLPMVSGATTAVAPAATVTPAAPVAPAVPYRPGPPIRRATTVTQPTAATSAAPAASSQPRKPALGEQCPICKGLVMRRQLLTDYFEGCLC